MYTDFAHLWPLISDPADYAAEAAVWANVLQDRLGPGRLSILELGVGGGNNLSHLTSCCDAVAVDLSEGMLEHSRRLNPSVEHHVGDMRTVRLNREFDAVLIHDAVSYLLTEEDIRATLQTAAIHLRTSGVLVMAPDHFEENFVDGTLRHDTAEDSDTKLIHIDYVYRPDPTRPRYESRMIYIIRQGGQVQIEQDNHVFGLFAQQVWLDLMQEAGFEASTAPYDVHEDHHQSCLLVGVLE